MSLNATVHIFLNLSIFLFSFTFFWNRSYVVRGTLSVVALIVEEVVVLNSQYGYSYAWYAH